MKIIKTEKPKLTNKELSEVLQKETGLSSAEVEQLLSALTKVMIDIMRKDLYLWVGGFFKLSIIKGVRDGIVRFRFKSSPAMYRYLKKLEDRIEELRGRNRDRFYGSKKDREAAEKRLASDETRGES